MSLIKDNNKKGFILISMLFMMVLLAVTAITLNRRAALQSRMAVNQISSIQTALGQSAATEKVIWELTKDPMWRTAAGGENYAYAGTTYNRKVLSSSVTGYTDAVVATVTAPGAASGTSTAFRYYINDFLTLVRPYHIFCDAWDNIYLADYSNHLIIKVDSSTGAMTRVAGTGTSGYSASEDGGPATSAKLDTPCGVWVDASGLIYIADRNNHRIRRVDLAGNITTVAGTGTGGYSSGENGGPATSAKLYYPTGVYGDEDGNFYIADTLNNRIRKVDTSGIITRVAGRSSTDWYGGDGGQATSAYLDTPRGVYVEADGSAFYIADTDNHRIRKVDNWGDISTVAGDGTGGFSGDGGAATSANLKMPQGVFVDSTNNIYIADTDNHCIRKVDTSGDISTVAGIGESFGYSGDGGLATSANLRNPKGVFVDSEGNIFIADQENSVIRVVSVHDSKIYTLAGTGSAGYDGGDLPAVDSRLNKPGGITMASTRGGMKIYLSGRDNDRIRVLAFRIEKGLY